VTVRLNRKFVDGKGLFFFFVKIIHVNHSFRKFTELLSLMVFFPLEAFAFNQEDSSKVFKPVSRAVHFKALA